jgi:hypothetical protein
MDSVKLSGQKRSMALRLLSVASYFTDIGTTPQEFKTWR